MDSRAYAEGVVLAIGLGWALAWWVGELRRTWRQRPPVVYDPHQQRWRAQRPKGQR